MNCPSCRQPLPRRAKTVQRTIVTHRHASAEMPQRFVGLNTTMRRRICPFCIFRFVTLELTERDLDAMIRRGSIAVEGPVQTIRPKTFTK